MRRVCGVIVLALGCTARALAGGPDVLIVYDGGALYKTIAPAADEGAIAGATAASVNCRTIAERLGAALESRNLTVRLAGAAEIRDYRELLEARMVVLGSPVRFSNMSWEMKRLMDEHFYGVYTRARPEFARRKVAAFAMGEVEPGARAALDAIAVAVRECGGTPGDTLAVVAGTSRADAERDIRQFAAALAEALR